MTEPRDSPSGRRSLIFERQWLHLLVLMILLTGLMGIDDSKAFREGQLWGISSLAWFWLAVAVAIFHQVFVWFCWRTQLHQSWLTRLFGDRGFGFYAVGFSILGILRVVLVVLVAISNQQTLGTNPLVLKSLALILLLPAVYLFYSVKRYFGFERAFGIDHFDTAYRSLPFEQRGIFRYTRNGMYTYGFLLLWAIALWWGSMAALTAALFNQLYVWVHYFATESPDMKRIYGK